MNRLRIRVELNRRKTGVPMQELVSVVEETQKFLQLLAEDVNIDAQRGEWHASNFDPESLSFTAEFEGPASPEQIHSFGLAFGGSTSLRSETIAQFTRIADFIGEDELVGFGLYQYDEETEPSEWRCLSRRDALRFADEIHLLAKAAGVGEQESPLAVMNGSVGGRRLFKDRREREALAADPGKWIREVESNLSRRIALLEGELQTQTRKVQTMENSPDAEEKFLKMLGAMETFWQQAPRQLALAAPEIAPATPEFTIGSSQPRRLRLSNSWLGLGIGLAAAGAALVMVTLWWSTKSVTATQHYAPAQIVVASPTPPVTVQAPNLAGAENTAVTALETERRSLAEAAARRDATPEIAHQIALEIPSDLRSRIRSEVLVNVNVSIDRGGRVTAAEVASTKGEGADALTDEALKAARRFRFLPARQGKKTVSSKTVLTFRFNSDTNAHESIW